MNITDAAAPSCTLPPLLAIDETIPEEIIGEIRMFNSLVSKKVKEEKEGYGGSDIKFFNTYIHFISGLRGKVLSKIEQTTRAIPFLQERV